MKKSIYKNENNILIDLLYSLRLKARLKQSELAQRIGVPQSFISKIENGQRRIDIIELNKICKIFGITLTEFIQQFEERINAAKSKLPK